MIRGPLKYDRRASLRRFNQRTDAEAKRAKLNDPEPKQPARANKCKECGSPISPESTYCGECLCEDDGI